MNIPENIIIRSIQRNASEEELKVLKDWLAENEKHSAFYFQLEEIWSARKTLPEEEIRQGWEMLEKQIEQQPKQYNIKEIFLVVLLFEMTRR